MEMDAHERILNDFDTHSANGVLVFVVELENKDGFDIYVNDNHIHIPYTLIHSKDLQLRILSQYFTFLLGLTNRRNDMSEKLTEGIIKGITKSISISANGRNGYSVFVNGSGNTSRTFPINYDDVNRQQEGVVYLNNHRS